MDKEKVILGVGDLEVVFSGEKELITYALGSCVAITVLDLKNKRAGMAHIALPDSSTNRGRSVDKPGYFADTAIAELFRRLAISHDDYSRKKIIIKIVGGAEVMSTSQVFAVGPRNVEAVRKLLWKYRLGIAAEHVGGRISRSVKLIPDSGRLIISSPDRKTWEI